MKSRNRKMTLEMDQKENKESKPKNYHKPYDIENIY